MENSAFDLDAGSNTAARRAGFELGLEPVVDPEDDSGQTSSVMRVDTAASSSAA